MNASINISNVCLKTPRLTLRPFVLSDLENFYQYAKVPGVGEMAGWSHHHNIEESKKILDIFIANQSTFAIVFQDIVIGSIGLDQYKENDFPELDMLKGIELGFVLSKQYWGQGLMVEGCQAVIDYIFKKLELDFILCGHFVDNNQSKRVQEKLGFKLYKSNQQREYIDQTKNLVVNIMFRTDYIA